MTTLLNSNDYEKEGEQNIIMGLNDLYIQVKFHGGDETLAKERAHLGGAPTVDIMVKLENPPDNSDGFWTDFSTIKTIVDHDAAFKITVPAGTDVRAYLRNNSQGRRVRVWGVEA